MKAAKKKKNDTRSKQDKFFARLEDRFFDCIEKMELAQEKHHLVSMQAVTSDLASIADSMANIKVDLRILMKAVGAR